MTAVQRILQAMQQRVPLLSWPLRFPQAHRWPLRFWNREEADLNAVERLIAEGELMADLMRHPGWPLVEAARDFYCELYAKQCVAVGTPDTSQQDRDRLLAAAHLAALQGFFNALKLCVAEGKRQSKRTQEAKREEAAATPAYPAQSSFD